jgi:hypothetical protein
MTANGDFLLPVGQRVTDIERRTTVFTNVDDESGIGIRLDS